MLIECQLMAGAPLKKPCLVARVWIRHVSDIQVSVLVPLEDDLAIIERNELVQICRPAITMQHGSDHGSSAGIFTSESKIIVFAEIRVGFSVVHLEAG